MKQLDEIKARCEAATAGLWDVNSEGRSVFYVERDEDGREVGFAIVFTEANARLVADARETQLRLVKALEDALETVAEEFHTTLCEEDAEDALESYKDHIAAILAGEGRGMNAVSVVKVNLSVCLTEEQAAKIHGPLVDHFSELLEGFLEPDWEWCMITAVERE